MESRFYGYLGEGGWPAVRHWPFAGRAARGPASSYQPRPETTDFWRKAQSEWRKALCFQDFNLQVQWAQDFTGTVQWNQDFTGYLGEGGALCGREPDS
jgi:hypothetical protein